MASVLSLRTAGRVGRLRLLVAPTKDGLFIGQRREFFAVVGKLAEAENTAEPADVVEGPVVTEPEA